MHASRAFVASLLAASVLAAVAAPALASCRPPLPVSENAQLADAVVYGEVVGTEGPPGRPGAPLVFAVKRVLKGSVPERIVVQRGPRESEPGQAGVSVATSVDYDAAPGTDHVLYLTRHAPAGFSTNACNGSHAGPPTPIEAAFFGPGSDPERTPTGIGGATDLDRGLAALAVLTALAAGVAAIVYALRSARASAA